MASANAEYDIPQDALRVAAVVHAGRAGVARDFTSIFTQPIHTPPRPCAAVVPRRSGSLAAP
jgi:hypothetical protein